MAARLMPGAKKIFFDGGSRPAGMETAIVVSGRSIIKRDLGPGTSMDAEWRALIAAARCAHDLGLTDVLLLGDCAAVIAQATKTTRCPPSCAAHLAAFTALPRAPGKLRIRYIRRTQNLAGIALARLHDR
jgi:ribonuclease HI